MSVTTGFFYEDLRLGMSATLERQVTDEEIRRFSEISGDTNPVHLDEAFAKTTRFGGRIAQGMLGASFISAVIGSKLPGYGTIYLSQNLSFRAPVRLGDTVITEAVVTELRPEKSRILLKTTCRVGATVVIDGEALVMVPKRG